MSSQIKIFGGRANPQLTHDICNYLQLPVGKIGIKQFADNELYVQFEENIRGCDVFLLQSVCQPVNDNLMELLLMANAATLASAKRITAVIFYYGYARQDRKDRPRVALSAKVVADMLQSQRIKRVLTMDLHSAPIQGFFNIPVDHLYALPKLIEYLKHGGRDISKLTIVSPDVGGVARARMLAMRLKAPLAIIDKFRESANVSEVMNVIGDVEGRDCLMVDDMIDTGGTLIKGATALIKKGALSVDAAATHGIFSPSSHGHKMVSALDLIEKSPLRSVIVMDTIPQDINVNESTKLVPLSVAPMFAQAITAINKNESVSGLFV